MLNPQRAYPILFAFVMLAVSMAIAQSVAKAPAKDTRRDNKTFDTEMQNLRDTWVQEFNAGHADKVAALYTSDAVLMRWDGSVHGYDSILAELERSARAGAHDYVVHSLHTERSGDLGYDTGAYNVTLSRNRVVEGNYLVVVKLINGQWKIVAHASVANPAQKP
jgi:hypothetical protein